MKTPSISTGIEIPISPLPHLGVPPGLTHSIPIRVVFRVDRSGKPVEILGVFMDISLGDHPATQYYCQVGDCIELVTFAEKIGRPESSGI
jgi:hypothetical protein